AVLEFGPVMPSEGGKGQGALLADRIAVAIEQNRAEPGEELAAPVVAAQRLPRFHEGVLRQIFGEGCVVAKRDGLAQQAGFIKPAKRAERCGFACSSPLEPTARVR